MFDAVVVRYDLVNALLSLGLDRWWRRRTVRAIASPPGARVLDLGCGTGKLAELLAEEARVVGLDLSQHMLVTANERLGERIAFVRGSMFALPFADGVFQGATSAFVLRNLSDLPGAFAELARVTEQGASLALVDITGPRRAWLRRPFDVYFDTVAPLLGRLVGQAEAYRYLARSLAQLPAPEVICQMLEGAGFVRVEAHPLSGGMVTVWTATRARRPHQGLR
jgi:demethylmenaquinone methyltransferase/2-methoxy-6-polyprenyl-1,4-benzoquinol methylase